MNRYFYGLFQESPFLQDSFHLIWKEYPAYNLKIYSMRALK